MNYTCLSEVRLPYNKTLNDISNRVKFSAKFWLTERIEGYLRLGLQQVARTVFCHCAALGEEAMNSFTKRVGTLFFAKNLAYTLT